MTENQAEQLLYAEEARKVAHACGDVYIQRDPVTNWPEIIKTLRFCHGYSLRRIGDALGVAHTTVQKWEAGSPPNYEDGAAIKKLYGALTDAQAARRDSSSRRPT